jgi:hypothetical protein
LTGPCEINKKGIYVAPQALNIINLLTFESFDEQSDDHKNHKNEWSKTPRLTTSASGPDSRLGESPWACAVSVRDASVLRVLRKIFP